MGDSETAEEAFAGHSSPEFTFVFCCQVCAYKFSPKHSLSKHFPKSMCSGRRDPDRDGHPLQVFFTFLNVRLITCSVYWQKHRKLCPHKDKTRLFHHSITTSFTTPALLPIIVVDHLSLSIFTSHSQTQSKKKVSKSLHNGMLAERSSTWASLNFLATPVTLCPVALSYPALKPK